MSDLERFTEILAGIGELYGKAISKPLASIYWKVLKKFEFIDVENAIQAHLHNPDGGQYFPKPADIVRWIEGSGETKALHAWTMVERAMHQVGCYQSLAFDDPIIHIVLEDMGGWVKLCAMTLKEAPFCASEFQKRYMGYVLKKPKRYPRYLWGISERDNASRGFDMAPPLLVGDVQKAKAVIATGSGMPLLVHKAPLPIQELCQHLPFSQKIKEDEPS